MAIAGFNESYYLQTNKDVLTAYLQGKTTAEEHFLKFGANELRNPNANFDMAYYAAANPDVVAAVKAGTYANVYDHYIKNGGKEGRIPSAALANFNGAAYLAANTDLAGKYTAANVVEHYVLYGAAEGRSGGTAQQVTGNYVGTTGDDTVTPAGGQASTVRVEGGQQGAKGDTLVITSGSAASFQVINLGTETGDQNQTRDNTTGTGGGAKVGPVVQGFENVDATAATINMNITALDRTSITNTGSAAATISGSVIQGGTGRDTLTGNTGNDSLVGNDGNDVINGAAGNDTILAGVGDDSVDGGTGNDSISSGTGADTIFGGAGNDTINIDGTGTKSVDGGADNDTINVTADQGSTTTVTSISGGAGNDTINLDATGITAASRVTVTGSLGNDTIRAGLGAETVNGGANNDTVVITTANLGANDLFNGNDGQDFIQLEIPGGSGTNTFVFQSLGTTAATSQFRGFEGVELIDKSGNTNAKSYKIVLTDTFVAQNLVSGSFLLDARGLPGGSNVVIDFSQLTVASSGLFAAGAFRVLASPSTDIRDQNNFTITSTYTINQGNSVLANTAAFTVFAGDTSVVAGTRNTDGTINTNGQAAYTTTGGSVETSTVTNGTAITLTAANAIVGTSFDAINTNAATNRFTTNADVVNAATFFGTATLLDTTAGDGDSINGIIASTGTITPVLTGIETLNLTSLAATSTLALGSSSGYSTINFAAGSPAAAQTISGLANGVTFNIANGAFASLDAGAIAGAGTVTYNLNGGTLTALSDTGTGNHTITTAAGTSTTITTLTTGALAAGSSLTISGGGNLTVTNALVGGPTVINASALTGNLTLSAQAATASTVTGGSGNDSITGSSAADSLVGGIGNDTLVSNGGADTLTGGAGSDRYVLGGGVDIVRITSSTDGGSTGDLIGVTGSTFTSGTDFIRITDTLRTEIDRDLNGALTGVTTSTSAAGDVATAANTEVLFSLTANSALSSANFSNMSAVATALNAMFNFTATANGTAMLVLVTSSGAATDSALYYYKEAGGSTGNNAVDASELTLIGVLNTNAALTAAAADLVFGT